MSEFFVPAVNVFSAALALVSLGAIGAAISKVICTWLDSIARNPEASGRLLTPALLGFAGIEICSLAIIGFAFLLIFR